uniref:F-box protein SKIP22 n=2 Tax=Noccaea caerulescens TaxID=107243 RepID=A0A1J3GEZ4_NOCCA
MSCELVMSVHAVMLESGFLLFDQDSDMRFRFSEEISLSYTLPALIKANESTSGIETVSLKFRRLGGHMVVVYGSLGSGGSVRKVYFDKRRYVHIVGLLMETEREDTLSIHRAVLMCWRMIKDGLVTPLLIDLCYETGLKPPPCLMCLPLELKRKIVECLHGMFVARLACVSSEFRDLASDNDLWKQKCLEEYEDLVTGRNYNVVDWKEKFAIHWMRRGFSPYRRLRAFHYPLEI